MIKKTAVLALLGAALLSLHPSGLLALDVAGLLQPESALLDETTGSVYVSNVNGAPTDKDNNGLITQVNADGTVIVMQFITPQPGIFELHAPKGLAIDSGKLYVVDIGAVRVFNLADGKHLKSIVLTPSDGLLNDIVKGFSGDFFVSDMLGNRIFRINALTDEVVLFKEGAELGEPNGLFFDAKKNRLLAVTWKTGQLIEIDASGQIRTLKNDLGEGLDGITADTEGDLFVSNYFKGEIYRIRDGGEGSVSLEASGLVTPADISFDARKHSLLVPLMSKNVLVAHEIHSPVPEPADVSEILEAPKSEAAAVQKPLSKKHPQYRKSERLKRR